ncbi:hypothetical protein QJQ45_023849 [Haematococcus lacustris]|nr:hypothetical protein QJQ45_023849 [Haematococcus lacustris]
MSCTPPGVPAPFSHATCHCQGYRASACAGFTPIERGLCHPDAAQELWRWLRSRTPASSSATASPRGSQPPGGEMYPVETDVRLCDVLKTGVEVTVDMEKDQLTDHSTGKVYPLKSIGDAGPVIDAGGIFDYARKTGMIQTV